MADPAPPPAQSSKRSFRLFLGVLLLVAAGLLAAVWAWVVWEPLGYMPLDYSMWVAKSTMIQNHQTGDVVILGDSAPTADLIPSEIGPGVVNLALGGGSPIETYYIARKILNGPSPPKAAILSLAPFHFANADFYWPYSAGFHFLSYTEAEEVRERSRTIGDNTLVGAPSPFDVDYRLRFLLCAIRFPSCYFPALMGSHFYGRYDANAAALNVTAANRGQHYFGLSGNVQALMDTDASLDGFYPLKILDDYFDRTLALFQEHHVPVYFIAMPHNVALKNVYRPGLKPGYTDYLAGYARRYPGFHVLGDTLPFMPSADFGDAWHLNTTGAPLWSAQVRQMLIDANAPGGPFAAGKN